MSMMPKPGRDAAAGGVDVELDVALGVVVGEEQHLGDDGVGRLIGDGAAEDDDAVLEQARVDVVSPLAAAGLFDDDRDQGVLGHCSLGIGCPRMARRVTKVESDRVRSPDRRLAFPTRDLHLPSCSFVPLWSSFHDLQFVSFRVAEADDPSAADGLARLGEERDAGGLQCRHRPRRSRSRATPGAGAPAGTACLEPAAGPGPWPASARSSPRRGRLAVADHHAGGVSPLLATTCIPRCRQYQSTCRCTS